jgi:hypothetical protein
MRIYVLLPGGTSHYVIDQSMINICDMKNLLREDAHHNPLDSTQTSVQTNYLISNR